MAEVGEEGELVMLTDGQSALTSRTNAQKEKTLHMAHEVIGASGGRGEISEANVFVPKKSYMGTTPSGIDVYGGNSPVLVRLKRESNGNNIRVPYVGRSSDGEAYAMSMRAEGSKVGAFGAGVPTRPNAPKPSTSQPESNPSNPNLQPGHGAQKPGQRK